MMNDGCVSRRWMDARADNWSQTEPHDIATDREPLDIATTRVRRRRRRSSTTIAVVGWGGRIHSNSRNQSTNQSL